MKKTFTLILALLAFYFSHAQYNVSLNNADMESSTAMSTPDNKNYYVDGFRLLEQPTVSNVFDFANSGLAPGEGVGGSQAFKSTIHNSRGENSDVLFFKRVDISGYGYADFTYSVKMKASNTVTKYPIWMVLVAFDEDGNNVSNNTLSVVKNGGNLNWADLTTDFQDAYIEFSIGPNGTGKDAKEIELRFQHASFNNTYLFDNFSVTSSLPLSTKSFKKIGVSMYPNPVSTLSYIKSNTPIETVSLYSLTGKLLLNKKVNTNEYQLDVSSYSKGMYLLSVTNTKGTSTSKLIVD